MSLRAITTAALFAVTACYVQPAPPPPAQPAPPPAAETTPASAPAEGEVEPPEGPTDQQDLAGLTEMGAVECHGAESRVIENASIQASGTAVAAHGSCNLVVRYSVIRGAQAGVEAHGSANVTIESCTIEAPTALAMHGSANVLVKNTQVIGRVDKHGSANFTDGGGNTWK